MSDAGSQIQNRRREAVSHIITDALCENNDIRKDNLMQAICFLKKAYAGHSYLDDLLNFGDG